MAKKIENLPAFTKDSNNLSGRTEAEIKAKSIAAGKIDRLTMSERVVKKALEDMFMAGYEYRHPEINKLKTKMVKLKSSVANMMQLVEELVAISATTDTEDFRSLKAAIDSIINE